MSRFIFFAAVYGEKCALCALFNPRLVRLELFVLSRLITNIFFHFIRVVFKHYSALLSFQQNYRLWKHCTSNNTRPHRNNGVCNIRDTINTNLFVEYRRCLSTCCSWRIFTVRTSGVCILKQKSIVTGKLFTLD